MVNVELVLLPVMCIQFKIEHSSTRHITRFTDFLEEAKGNDGKHITETIDPVTNYI